MTTYILNEKVKKERVLHGVKLSKNNTYSFETKGLTSAIKKAPKVAKEFGLSGEVELISFGSIVNKFTV